MSRASSTAWFIDVAQKRVVVCSIPIRKGKQECKTANSRNSEIELSSWYVAAIRRWDATSVCDW